MIRRLQPCLWLVTVLLPLLGVGSLPGDAARSPASGLGPRGEALAQVVPRGGPIHEENQRPGTTRWQSAQLARAAERERQRLGTPRDPHPETLSPWAPRPLAPAVAAETWMDTPIRGYASQTSVNRGSSIGLHVATVRPQFSLEVYRMGWYGGTGATLMLTATGISGQNHAVPTPQADTGLIAANWPIAYLLQTGANWVSGVYLVKLISSAGEEAWIPFVLRDDGAAADIVYQVPVTTYQAYNNWGGKSLYDYQSNNGQRAHKVSFDRPYANWDGAGMFFDGDYNMIRFLESQGYNITYVTSVDVQSNPAIYTSRKVFLSNWHDEYWSKQMRDNITAARDAGKHLAWFDSNNVYWQIRFESSAGGVPNRIIVCYKEAAPIVDPLRGTSLETVRWREAPVNQPENALLGIIYESLFGFGTSAPWVVSNASHWVYAGTGLFNGSQIPGLVGYEYDRVWSNGLTPAGLAVLATSPVHSSEGFDSTHNASIYTAPSGALVFSAGTNYFPWKVDANPYQDHGVEPAAQQIVRNVLNRMIGPSVATPTATRTPTPIRTATPVAPTATPTVPPSCTSARPAVGVAVQPSGAGRLQVTVTAGAGAGIALRTIQFGAATNALIDAGPLVGVRGDATVSLAPGATSFVFYVRRDSSGQATHVPVTITDSCGPWPTFVGGGPTAF